MLDFSNLPGNHNLENITSSFVLCRLLGIDPHRIFSKIASFRGLRHRMQLCGLKIYDKQQKICFYNDSKATNSDSAKKSIKSLNNIFWIAGGVFKEDKLNLGQDISHIKKAYLYGRDSKLIAFYIKDTLEYTI